MKTVDGAVEEWRSCLYRRHITFGREYGQSAFIQSVGTVDVHHFNSKGKFKKRHSGVNVASGSAGDKNPFEPPQNLISMYDQSSAENTGQRLKKKRTRTRIACCVCRKRKIRCHVDRNSYQNPCYRCARLDLTCEYLTVADDPEASSSSSAGPSESSPTEPELPTAYQLSDSRASDLYGSQTHPDPTTAQYTSEMVDPTMRTLLYHHGSIQPALGLGSYPLFPQPDHYVHRPVPESVIYEAASMQRFMALSRASSMSQPTQDIPNQRNILQQMYQPSR
ncbi:hypothetical protein C8J56DRAFT_897128 [Mycena floridula]|nr:hypothetical protein C8J56DRAFT_897128 [Mycena floridula]